MQAGIIEKSLSAHQLNFCTRKIKKPNKHNYITIRSIKHVPVEIYEEALGQLTFPDYENFGCVNKAHSDLTSKLFNVVNKVAPIKTIRVKNNTNEWFDGQVAEKIATRDKLFRKFQKSKLSVDEILYKEARNTAQALIKDKKRKLLQEKLSKNLGKPKELWKVIKKLGLPDKKAPTTSICLNTKKKLTFSPRTIANTFKKHFANLASDLVEKLPHPTGKFEIPSVSQYYKEINFREKKQLKFEKVISVSILKILKEFKTTKLLG